MTDGEWAEVMVEVVRGQFRQEPAWDKADPPRLVLVGDPAEFFGTVRRLFVGTAEKVRGDTLAGPVARILEIQEKAG